MKSSVEGLSILSLEITSLDPVIFLGADKTKPAVRQGVGVSGTGKTELMKELIRRAEKSPKMDEYSRLIIFDIKHDGYESLIPEKSEPITDFMGYEKSLTENRLTLIHPEISEAQDFLDEIIDHLFRTSERIEGFSGTLILEESSTYITGHKVPDSLKRFATQGRSMGLSLILLNQRCIGNRWVDTQTASMFVFRLARPDADLLRTRWGICPDKLESKLSEKRFSFAHFDLESLKLDFYEPIKLKDE